MANKNLFRSIVGKLLPKTDACNEERAPAYRFSDKHALAQFAATGCLNSTFYATDVEQLDKVLACARPSSRSSSPGRRCTPGSPAT